jgi:hypothetical protein
VSDVSGESTVFLSRGKKRLGFHLKLKFEFEGRKIVYKICQGLNILEGENGAISYTDFTDDGDREVLIILLLIKYTISTESNKKK